MNKEYAAEDKKTPQPKLRGHDKSLAACQYNLDAFPQNTPIPLKELHLTSKQIQVYLKHGFISRVARATYILHYPKKGEH